MCVIVNSDLKTLHAYINTDVISLYTEVLLDRFSISYTMELFQPMCAAPDYTAWYRRNKNSNTLTIFIMLSSMARSHMREFTLGHLSESRSAPGGCQTLRPRCKL